MRGGSITSDPTDIKNKKVVLLITWQNIFGNLHERDKLLETHILEKLAQKEL